MKQINLSISEIRIVICVLYEYLAINSYANGTCNVNSKIEIMEILKRLEKQAVHRS